ncbi:MAG TPA: proton-conducting membrane transporter [Elusimicrobia bacterium]|nr:proton-conducting membrane transporter [Elusimicrobiota bacterium]
MIKEEEIKQEIIKNFSYLDGKIRVQRVRRIFVDVPYENFDEVFKHLIKNTGFEMLCTITGLDEGATFGLIYHLARKDGIVLNLKINVPKANPIIKTVINYFPGAIMYEREIVDLFGIKVEGLPSGARYPLPDNWPIDEYPLRKDWKPENLNQKMEKK